MVCLTTFALVYTAVVAAAAAPNIVLVVIDDMGSNDVGFRSHQIATPNIDAIAQRGCVLERYYSERVCTPARASLLTGRHSWRFGLQNYVIESGTQQALPLSATTLAERLAATRGYEAHAVGKWHLGMASWQHTPTFRGFNSFVGFYNGGEDYYTHEAKARVDDTHHVRGYDMRFDARARCGAACSRVAYEYNGTYSTHVFARRAVDVIDAWHGLGRRRRANGTSDAAPPLFLYLAFQGVHHPNEVPATYTAPYERTIADAQRRTYAGMLAAVDEGIGNVTRALQRAGALDDTVVVVISDNGG
eukprot:CAMPEP_0198348040 /NCGR_PEP_ID=MMETSP1450-20131203/87946_1 /TAXON_ID=753684 ORGANISM="Madagascaria erythrocladiodes, Strain CCMP3234" /NCGR_SAMPLE_ID=MMETSP1450 /ASSEMBLY_ACC=CAM_ASM_001115 /LENGTH=302 /DNA_ID=CAMNT_0044053623 /DNA_START=67 /DNA_END=972 /DNA_ORIENTATION=-